MLYMKIVTGVVQIAHGTDRNFTQYHNCALKNFKNQLIFLSNLQAMYGQKLHDNTTCYSSDFSKSAKMYF